jgi:hypothetical protein
MRAAYGDATAEIFLIAGAIAVVALIAVLLIKEQPLRRTVDIRPEAAASDAGPQLRRQAGRTAAARTDTCGPSSARI